MRARRAISIAARPNSRPSAKLSVEIAAAPTFSSAEAASNSRRRCAAYGNVRNAISRAGGRERSSSSTTAALTPSCDVPDIRPMARTLPRSSRSVICAHFLSASGSSSSSDSCESSGRLSRSISTPASSRRQPEGNSSEPESSCDSGIDDHLLARGAIAPAASDGRPGGR